MECGIAPPAWPGVRGRDSDTKQLRPHLGECEIHKSALEIQEKVGISEATIPGGLGCIGVDVEVSLR